MFSKRWLILASLCVIGLVLSTAFILGGPRGAVDWSQVRALAIESDDWGFAGFAPSIAAWQGIDRQTLAPGRFPEVYWHSTLEDSATVAGLHRLFLEFRGRDGQPVVFQPNYVMSSLALSADGLWQRYDLPDSPPQYRRPGLWRAVRDAIADGVWYPEYHAAWHYDPDLRREAIGQSPLAREAAVRGIVLFPGSEHARELGRWRPMTDLAAELDAGTRIFQTVFGRPVGSVIAPDYTWDAALEDLWDSRDLRVIQAKREQRNPAYGRGQVGRVRKLLARNWARLTHADRCYLERNVRLEPVQAADPGAKVAEAVGQVAVAWDRGEPAIVEIHRVNLAHLDPAVAMTGQQMLQEFLAGCAALEAEAPLYLSDFEIAQLTGSGVSWSVRGTRLILHNVSHARRLVPVPAAVVRGLSGDGPGSPGPLMVLGAGESAVLELERSPWPIPVLP